MRKYISSLGLILLVAGGCFAQAAVDSTAPSTPSAKAIKFDEFGDVSRREFAPKLAKFIETLRKNDYAGSVIIYNSFNNSPFRRSHFYLQRKKAQYVNYLLGSYDAPRIIFVDGPSLDKMRTELWLVPPGAEWPPIESAEHEGPGVADILPAKITEGAIDLARAAIRKAGHESATEEADISFDFLKTLKANSGTLIFYFDDTVFDLKRAWAIVDQKLRKAAAPDILKRVKIIFGGYRDEPSIEVWDVLPGGIEPEPLPDEKIDPVN
jgi:hypothetical protein